MINHMLDKDYSRNIRQLKRHLLVTLATVRYTEAIPTYCLGKLELLEAGPRSLAEWYKWGAFRLLGRIFLGLPSRAELVHRAVVVGLYVALFSHFLYLASRVCRCFSRTEK